MSHQFKSISRDQYYHYMSNHQDITPAIGHYNPKFSSVYKRDNKAFVDMNEKIDNEADAKNLKQ